MSKLTNIKDKIIQLEGGAFQEFCDHYLVRKGYEGIFELGMKSGTMKTTTGNPDTYFKGKSGKYIFVAYTTQQASINSKIEEDIIKCLDKTKTGINTCDIEEIICCHTSSTLDAGKDKALHEMCEKEGILLSLYGVDRIANDIYQYFRVLARDFLEESIDTNQIFDIREFVRRYDSNEMAAPLATTFQFRDDNLTEVVKAIESNKVVIVFGKAGVGKTRLTIEACKRFLDNNEYRFFCVSSNDLPIYEDLTSYISTPGKYLIFIDDANELNGLKHVLQYLNLEQLGYEVKIISTVRDYARRRVIDEVEEFTVPKKIEIDGFSDEEIGKFIEENLHIYNQLYLDQIVKIAEGNPRIAFLAGKLANSNQNLKSIQNVTELYEVYYGKYINTSIISTDTKVCLSAGIIALLHTINLEHLDKLEIIFDLIGMNESEFINNLELLHGMEFVEIYYDKVARISDQCLSNYMLYYTFFQKKLIPFSEILKVGFENFRIGIIRAINILLNIFYSEESHKYIEKEVNLIWEKYEKEDYEGLFFEFVKVFHDFKPVESLLYVQNKIECMKNEEVDIKEIDFCKNIGGVKDEILLILAGYRHSEYILEALELIIRYLKKRQSIVLEASETFVTYFGVDKHSYDNDYYTLKNVARVLFEQCNDSLLMQSVFINVSGKLLNLYFSPTEAGRGNRITMYKIPVKLTDGAREYRSILWEKLITLSKHKEHKEKILEILEKYSQGWMEEIDSKVLEFDLPYIEHLINNVQEIGLVRTAKTCYHLIEKYKHYSILVNNKFIYIFNNREWIIYSILTERYYEDDIGFEEAETKRKNSIDEYAKKYEEGELNEFVCISNNIVEQLSNENWNINNGIQLFCNALESNESKYLEFVNCYINSGSKLDIYPKPVIIKLFEYIGVKETFSLINHKDFAQKNSWMFNFFEALPEEDINNKWIGELLKFFKRDEDKNIKTSPYRNLKFLDKYTKVKSEIYIDVVSIINEKFKYSPFIANIYLGLLFNKNVYKPVEVIKIFEENKYLLQDIYFKMINYDVHADYAGDYIKEFIENDESWLQLYIKYIIDNAANMRNRQRDRIGACWLSSNYEEIFDKIFYELEKVDEIYRWRAVSFFKNILIHEDDGQDKTNNQINWLKHIISDNCKDEKVVDIFGFISELRAKLRKDCIIHFIKVNKDYELFEKLELEPNHWGGMGSMIPYMEKRITFYEALLPYLTGLDLLKHKKLILKKIEIWKLRIEREQIDEILEERLY